MSDLAREIETVRFTPVRLRNGYDMDDIDNLLDRLVEAARAGTPLAPLVESASIGVSRMREGYDMDEVDRFLSRTTGRRLVRATPSTESTHASAVREVRGPLARLLGMFRRPR